MALELDSKVSQSIKYSNTFFYINTYIIKSTEYLNMPKVGFGHLVVPGYGRIWLPFYVLRT